MAVEREAWYQEAEEEDLGSSDLRVWESQLRGIVSETEMMPVPDDPSMEDDLFNLRREAEEAWQHIQTMLDEYPEKIRGMMDQIGRIRAGRLIYGADRSGLPGPSEEWDEAERADEDWESEITDDGDEDEDEGDEE